MAKLEKKNMIVGKRYRGYGAINEYGEFCFEPEETGAHAGREKLICVSNGIRVSETKNLILVKFNLEKQTDKLLYFKMLTSVYNEINKIIQKYDI